MAWDVTSWFKNECTTFAPDIVRKFHIAYLQDTSQNQYDAVGKGSPIFIDGTIASQRIVADGIDDYFAIIEKNYAVSSQALPLTLEARVSVDSSDQDPNGSDGTIILSFDRDKYYRFGIGSSVNSSFKTSLSLTSVGSPSDYSGNTDVADGVMKTLSVRYDPSTNGGQIKFFIDGASDAVVNSVGAWWGSNSSDTRYGILFGEQSTNVFNGTLTNGPAFKGGLEFIRVWEVARTDDEVNSYHDTTSLDTTSGLQLNYNMESFGDVGRRVMTWPTFRRHWSDIRPQSAAVTLANDDGYFNDLFQRPQASLCTYAFEYGLTHPDSGDELIVPFVGRFGNLSHTGGRLRIAIDDKVSQLSDLVVGDIDNPVTYTDSTLPSDIAWNVLADSGPFSNVQSTSNPDIDYASFSEWAGVFSSDTVEMNAEFTGQKITEIMRKIARYTQSAIYMEGGKIYFNRFTAVNTETTDIGINQTIGDASVRVDANQLVTKQTVLAGYDTSLEQWGIITFNIDSNASVSFGLREDIEKDQNIWYTTSVSAVNLAQRFTLIGGNPYEQIQPVTNLAPLPRQVGETINFTDNQTGLSKGYRIMEMEMDMNDGTFRMEINASQTETPFILDESTLDSADKLL